MMKQMGSLQKKMKEWLDHHGLLADFVNDEFWSEVAQSSRENMTWDDMIHAVSFIASSKIPQHPQWDYFAANVLIADHKDRTPESFCNVVRALQDNIDVAGNKRPLLHDEFVRWIQDNEEWVEGVYNEQTRLEPHFPISLFGWRTLYKSYLMRSNNRVMERPDHMWFRVALFLHRQDHDRLVQCFSDLRRGRYTHATPTLFYAGARRPQMASCFPWSSIVYTPHGGKPIGSIREGDLVLTHTGSWRRVLQVHSDVIGRDRHWKRVHWDGVVMDATSDHPFYVNDGEWKRLEDIDTSRDTFIHAARILPDYQDRVEQIRSGIDLIGQRMVPFRSFYIDKQESDPGNLPGEIRAAIVAYDESDDDHPFEYYLSMHARDWIPVIFVCLCKYRHDVNIRRMRDIWQEKGDVYINMWYEQWFDLIAERKIEKIETMPTMDAGEVVYTLGVEEDHSYIVQGWVAQNCFLVGTEDSLEGIFKTISDVAQISKWAGGLGIHISNIRADRSYIYGTNGYSNGILPMIRLYNDTSRYIDQCFEKDTRVWTKNHGWKRICMIRPGDLVLTQPGNYEPVERILSHVVRQDTMYRIHVGGGRTVDATTEHAVLVQVPDGQQDAPDEEDPILYESPIARAKNIYLPLSECSADTVAVSIRPPMTCPVGKTKHPWTRQWAMILGVLLKDTPVIRDPLVWEFRGTAPNIFGFGAEVSGSFVRWAENVLFPWAWVMKDDTYSPSIPYEWLTNPPGDDITGEITGLSCRVSCEWDDFIASLRFLHGGDGSGIRFLQKWDRVESIPWDESRHRVLYDLVVRNHPSYVAEIGIVHNGGGKRNGAFAMYLEPWHSDVMAFLHAKKNTGPEEERARDLFYGMWIPDLFMKRVIANDMWSLMCPRQCPGLVEAHGHAFDRLYTEYEEKKMFKKQIAARELFSEMIKCQIETGTPYFLYKDSCNKKSNQKHLGTIRSSNLCVAGNTMILTRNGYKGISRCAGQTVDIWNGESFISVVPLQTSDRSPDGGMIEITMASGKILQCTPDHVFYNDVNVRIKAKDLCVGTTLASYQLPSLDHFDGVAMEEIDRVCKFVLKNGFRIGSDYYIRSDDMSSLQEIHLNLELIGIGSVILPNMIQISIEAWRDLVRQHVRGSRCISESIKSITSLPNASCPVFCLREPMHHRAVFQGMLTGQCTEIIEYSDASEYAVCNLASIALPSCCIRNPLHPGVDEPVIIHPMADDHVMWAIRRGGFKNIQKDDSVDPMQVMVNGRLFSAKTLWETLLAPRFDFNELSRITGCLVENLNAVIDENRYPTPETRFSNLRHRPIGIGVQGLADVFCRLKIPFDSAEARQLNQDIFETIYFSALESSHRIAKTHGAYNTFSGSPLSEGIFHWEMDGVARPSLPMRGLDWDGLRVRIMQDGIRNSLLIAPMPTASTSQILNNNECFEPYTSNFYTRRTSVGEFLIYNQELFRDLDALGIWTNTTRQELLWNRGSVRDMKQMPEWIRQVYRTVWEIPQKAIIDMAADRQFFIDQSQSMNLFMAEPNIETLTKMHIYGWKKGLKTGSYYIRSRPPITTPHFALDPNFKKEQQKACPYRKKKDDSEECMACSS